MRGIDTNVLVRYVIADDPRQVAVAERVFEECREAEEPLFLPAAVICELAWVLERSYGQSREEIHHALDRLLTVDLLRFEHESLLRRSLANFRSGRGQFADYLIGEICKAAGCRDTLTFDKGLRNVAGYTLLT